MHRDRDRRHTTVTAGTGGARTASVGVPVGSSADVTVTVHSFRPGGRHCHGGVRGSDADSCAEHMGTLGVGTTTRTGTVAAVSDARRRSVAATSAPLGAITRVVMPSRCPPRCGCRSIWRPQRPTPAGSTRTCCCWRGHSGDGTGAVLGRNDDVGSGHGTHRYNSRLSGVELAPGDYTIEATTYGSRRTGDYTLNVVAVGGAGAACTDDLGTLAADRYVRTGTVAVVEGCTSRIGAAEPAGHLRAGTFTLDAPAWIDIDLAKANSSSLDPYLLLLSGHRQHRHRARAGQQQRHRHRSPDPRQVSRSRRLHHRDHRCDTYRGRQHRRLHPDSHRAHQRPRPDRRRPRRPTDHRQLHYWPTTRSVSIASQRLSTDILYVYFGFGHSAARGYGSVTLWPDRSAPHELSLSLSAVSSGSSSGATQGRSSTRSTTTRQTGIVENPRRYLFRVFSRCGPGEKLSPNNRILCVDASANVEVRTPGKETPVTTGTLLAIDYVADEAAAVRPTLQQRAHRQTPPDRSFDAVYRDL